MSEIAIDLSLLITAEEKAAQEATAAQEAVRNQTLAYLAETDWYVTRLAETGQAILLTPLGDWRIMELGK